MRDTFAILREREYRKYAAASLLAAVGTGMQFVAISWYLWTITGSASAIGWVLVVSALPGMLLSPWIGALVDRWEAKRICIGADLARAAILVPLIAIMHFHEKSIAAVYVCIFLIAVCDNFFQPAVGAMVRSIVDRERLLPANIVGNMCMQVGVLVGAGVGGLLLAKFDAPTVIVINAVALSVSAGLTFWIKTSSDVPRAQAKKALLFDEFKAGATYIVQHPHIVWLAMLQMFVYVTLYVCNTLLPAFVDKELGGGASAFGIIDAAWGAGALLGGLSLGAIAKRMDRRSLGVLGLLLLSVAIFVFLTSHYVPQAFLAYVMLGFLACVIRVNTDTILVSEVDPVFFGRVKAAIAMFISYMGLIVYICVGYLGDIVDIRTIYMVLGSMLFLGFLAAASTRFGIRSYAR